MIQHLRKLEHFLLMHILYFIHPFTLVGSILFTLVGFILISLFFLDSYWEYTAAMDKLKDNCNLMSFVLSYCKWQMLEVLVAWLWICPGRCSQGIVVILMYPFWGSNHIICYKISMDVMQNEEIRITDLSNWFTYFFNTSNNDQNMRLTFWNNILWHLFMSFYFLLVFGINSLASLYVLLFLLVCHHQFSCISLLFRTTNIERKC